MLKLINTKILLAILAAVVAIGAYLVHEHNLNVQAAASAARAAALLQQQRDDADAAKKHDGELWEQVRKHKQEHNSANVNGSHTWTHYLP